MNEFISINGRIVKNLEEVDGKFGKYFRSSVAVNTYDPQTKEKKTNFYNIQIKQDILSDKIIEKLKSQGKGSSVAVWGVPTCSVYKDKPIISIVIKHLEYISCAKKEDNADCPFKEEEKKTVGDYDSPIPELW